MDIKKGTIIAGIPYDPRKSGKAWEFIAYPDSVPENWIENLTQFGVEFAISPLHDRDISANGEPKKPHWHVICIWPNGTKWQTATTVCDIVHGPCCIPCANIRTKYDYLIHKNDANKAQYDPADIIHGNGFAISKYETLTSAEVNAKVIECTKLCREMQFTEYADLLFHLLDCEMFDEFDVVSNRTIYFTALIKGIWRKGAQYKVDPSTGEVLEDSNLSSAIHGGGDLQSDSGANTTGTLDNGTTTE